MRLRSALLILIAAASTGCQFLGHPETQWARKPAIRSEQLEAGFTPAQKQMIDDNCPFGAPVNEDDAFLGPTHFVFHEGYVLEHSDLHKIPYWVCESLEPSELHGSATRKNHFFPEPQLENAPRSELDDYSGSEFDRGHMAPAGDQKHSQQRNDETFSLANMAPQVGIGFNRHIWQTLEGKARAWAEQRGMAYVITGPLFWDPAEEDPATADGVIPFQNIGPGAVGVPTHFYKIILRPTASGADHWEAIAFVLENKKYKAPYDFADYIHSIDWIEARTGLDFLPDMDAGDEHALESVEPSLWPDP
jgi:endonuclease G